MVYILLSSIVCSFTLYRFKLYMYWSLLTYHFNIKENSDDDSWNKDSKQCKESLLVLESIRQDLQDALPPSCIFDTEAIAIPQVCINIKTI